MSQRRVLLMRLSERTSGKGNTYLSDWLGKASVVACRGEPNRFGHPTWEVFVSPPEPKPETQTRPEPTAEVSTPVERGEPRPAIRHVRRSSARPRASAPPETPFDAPLDDPGRE